MSFVKRRNLPELLAPAGSLEHLKAAVSAGADAIYMGGEKFGARAYAQNFSREDMEAGVKFAHENGVKVYVTANIVAHNEDLEGIREYFRELKEVGPDALIISDPGVFMIAKEVCPEIERHISTQANNTNYETFLFWYRLVAKRVVTARELSLEEIRQIRAHIPDDLEIETFIHGAMCISYSGRCLLSNYLAGRDANRGACAQPCRWNYHVMESTRPGQYFPVEETDEGTYIFNAKDLCMIEHLPELLDAGVDSLKIEGRNKSAYYVSVITNAYRGALDAAIAGAPAPAWTQQEVVQVSHREYCTGFFFGREQAGQRYESSSYVRNCDVAAVVQRWENGRLYLSQRNRFFAGDALEVLAPGQAPVSITAAQLQDGDGQSIETANHAMMDCSIACATAFPAGSMIRKPV